MVVYCLSYVQGNDFKIHETELNLIVQYGMSLLIDLQETRFLD